MDVNGNPLHILLVEDDALVRQTAGDMLQRFGFSVLTADSAAKALSICTEDHQHVDLVMTDLMMDEMNGIELRDQLLSVRPDIKVLFTSGHSYDVVAQDFAMKRSDHFIQKPYSLKELLNQIDAIIVK